MKTRLFVLGALALLPGLACAPGERGAPARRDSTAAPAIAVAPAAASADEDSTCDFVAVVAHPSGDSLIAEFLRRDAAGQFLQTDPWFDGATECPGHEAGPDAYTVIDGYDTRTLGHSTDSVVVEVASRRLGYVDGPGTFRAEPGRVVDTVRAVRTSYGWRIAAPSLRQFVDQAAARSRGDLSANARSDRSK